MAILFGLFYMVMLLWGIHLIKIGTDLQQWFGVALVIVMLVFMTAVMLYSFAYELRRMFHKRQGG